MEKGTIDNLLKVMAGTGNIGYLWEHVEYFEKAVPAEIAPFIELGNALNAENWAYQKCHNFSAWIRLYTELICNKALTRLSRNELCKVGPADFKFGYAARTIIQRAAAVAEKKGISKDRIDSMSKALNLVIELRHSLQHGGLPRMLRDEPQIKVIDLNEVASMAIPQNFDKTRQIFLDANALIELLPVKVIRLTRGEDPEFI